MCYVSLFQLSHYSNDFYGKEKKKGRFSRLKGNQRPFHPISECLPSLLTHNIISKPNGAEGNEGKVEALAKRPSLHVTEQQRRDDEKKQAASDEE